MKRKLSNMFSCVSKYKLNTEWDIFVFPSHLRNLKCAGRFNSVSNGCHLLKICGRVSRGYFTEDIRCAFFLCSLCLRGKASPLVDFKYEKYAPWTGVLSL